MHWDVADIECDECPVSYITQQSKELVAIDARQRRIREASGAALFGTDASRWLAWWGDVVTTIETQRVLEHNARSEAEIRAIKNRR